MNKPATKEDIARIQAFHQYLVPISKFKDQRSIKKELNETELSEERLMLKEDPESADTLLRNAIKDLVKTRKLKN